MVSPTPLSLQERARQRRELGTVMEDEPLSPSRVRNPASLALVVAKDEKSVRNELLYKLGFAENNGAIPVIPSNREPSRGSLLGRVKTTTEPLKYDNNFDRVLREKKERALQRETTTNVLSALGALFSTSLSVQQQSTPPEEETMASRDDVESSCQPPSSLNSTETEEETSCSSDDDTTTKSRRLTFNDQVTVIPIPKRDEYSKRIRDHLWVNARELQNQVARNTVEFASEGWDWRNVYEDEEMYVCAATGEKVHPVHYESGD